MTTLARSASNMCFTSGSKLLLSCLFVSWPYTTGPRCEIKLNLLLLLLLGLIVVLLAAILLHKAVGWMLLNASMDDRCKIPMMLRNLIDFIVQKLKIEERSCAPLSLQRCVSTCEYYAINLSLLSL
jgi:hypothetical protein